jgi:CRISPR system Cascade subunit CasB
MTGLPLENENREIDKVSLTSVIGSIAGAMETSMTTGDIAQLRRITCREPYTPALWKVLVHFVPDHWTRSRDVEKEDEKEQQWATILSGMANSLGLHDPKVPLGQALAEAGWSELRFTGLMRARGDELLEGVRRASTYLSNKRQNSNWSDMARMILNQEGTEAEKSRRQIARDYYRTLFKMESKH